jgi:lipoprotein-anchoring transpeptidase ErfK/SrfK
MTSGTSSNHSTHLAGSAQATTTTTPMPAVLIQPPNGSTNLALNTVVLVTATSGNLGAVQVTGSDGKPVSGALDPGHQQWQSSGPLTPKNQYTITIQPTTKSGKPAPAQISQFTTAAPAAVLQPTIFPNEGLTIGVGMPIQIRFNHSVANKDAVEAAFHVTESAPVAGGWHWFSDKELHFRPQVYWPAGEKVTVTANLTGIDAGNGVWGEADQTVHFAVGDAHISTANLDTHEMKVTNNGQTVATYPLSGGRDKYPTMGGTHIALYRQYDVHMVSSTVGIPVNSPDGYDEHVYWNINITDGGEFVHAAPWSVGSQGNTNVSHGCINLSVANATDFFNFSRAGDVVQVAGSPRPAELTDHGTMDWALPWASWTHA